MKGASKHTNKAHLANGAGYGFCGGQLNSATGTARSTICCKFCCSLKLLHVLVIGVTIIYKDFVFFSNANTVFNQIYQRSFRA